MKVWVLLFSMWTSHAGGPVVIDNIATAEECARVQRLVKEYTGAYQGGRCIEVWKVKQ